jgi:hypothetical protein
VILFERRWGNWCGEIILGVVWTEELQPLLWPDVVSPVCKTGFERNSAAVLARGVETFEMMDGLIY